MAAGIGNLFDGKKNDNGTSGEFELTAGAHMLEWSGVLTGGTIVQLEFNDPNLATSEWHPLDPALNINATSPNATNFMFGAVKIRATVINANHETNVAVGIIPLSGT